MSHAQSPNCLLAEAADAADSIKLYQALEDGGDVSSDGILNRYTGKCGNCALVLTMKAPLGEIVSSPEDVEVTIHSGSECTDDSADAYREQIAAKYK